MKNVKKVSRTARRIAAVLLCSAVAASSASAVVSALEPYGNGIRIRNWVTNDPEYSFSDEYKTSVWYQNFDSLELTGNQRNNVLRIAISQLGYHEGDSKKDFDGMNRGGSDNYIEYARLIVPNYNDNHYEWCACFVNWCLSQARIDSCYGEIGCWKWVEWLKANKMFQNSAAYRGEYIPQPADMIFFNWDETNTTSGHIGYVLYVDDTTVYTIEGNSDNAVSLKSYPLDARCIIGYGTPLYDESDEATIDWGYTDGYPAGVYVCKSTGSYLRATPDVRGKRITRTTVGHTVTLYAVSGEYGYVSDGENTGYMLLSDIILLTPMHAVTFTADGQTVGHTVFRDGQTSVDEPAVPEKEGYSGAWAAYKLGDMDLTVKAVYTPIEYTVSFLLEGETVGTATYTVESIPVLADIAPTIERDGFTVSWEDVILTMGDVTVNGSLVADPVTAPDAATESENESASEVGESGTAPDSETQATLDMGCESLLVGAPALCVLVAGGIVLTKKKQD